MLSMYVYVYASQHSKPSSYELFNLSLAIDKQVDTYEQGVARGGLGGAFAPPSLLFAPH